MLWSRSLVRRGLKFAAVWAACPAMAADMAYVTCQSSEQVGVIDLDRAEQVALWNMPGKPAGIAMGPAGEVFTVAPEGKAVRRLTTDGVVLAEALLDGGPTGIAYDAERGRLFISDWFNARLWVLDAHSLELIGELETGMSPAGIAISRDGTFLASADKDADQVSLFDAETLAPIATLTVGTRPYGLGFDDRNRLFVGNVGSNDMTVIDPEAKAILATVPVGERPYGVSFARGRAFVTNQYENTVSVIALDTLAPISTIEGGDYPEGIDTTADGTRVVFANWFDNTVSVVDATTLDMIETIDTCDGPRAFGKFLSRGEK